MTDTPIRYRLAPIDLAGHRCEVRLTIDEPAADGQIVSLPAWIPGSYLLREFARQIETIEARSGRERVALTKLDRNTWHAAPCRGPLVITCVIYAWDLSVRSAHLDQSHGFFNGTSVFLRVQGRETSPCLLELVAPDRRQTFADTPWQVYTSLPEATGVAGAARRHGYGLYQAPDYDALIDHPIEMGTPQVARFVAHGAEHELVFTGTAPGLDLGRIAADAKRICEAQIAFFEPETRRAPFLDSAQRYVFMTQITPDGYGGLEHRASTALVCARADLPVTGRAEQSDGYRTFLGLVSHEYFHTWHVKRIKPALFAPYDLSRENHTRLLWVFEGFTSYYDDLMLLRSGVIDLPAYLKLVAKTVAGVERAPGRHKQSVAESSFDAWTRYYRQDENSPNALVSYYTKGSLIALGLDITLRNATGGQRSLDDVMRLLWTRYGRDFYQGRPRGIPEDALPALIEEATGVDASAFITRYAEGREDVPVRELLATQRIATRPPKAVTAAGLDVRVRAQGTDAVLATVLEGGAAHRAGLSAHDVLVAIDGLRIAGSAGLDALLARYQPGASVTIHAFRGDELRAFSVRLGEAAPAEPAFVAE
ncbi:M61 family metallopeptidase [Achromobacter sp. GG226]|uniref:M61 family metallopeptidase n=1 Tax=Verticiella alkaliphila TaxID=2779529 RepID=UPI001C0C62BB|nr:PDZ domain-containing protein [Verticiella sp. GG226]MBU4609555.1 M61 family metallopeptidase [Verticiella sp. GG226]